MERKLNVAYESEYLGWTLITNFLDTDFQILPNGILKAISLEIFALIKKVPSKLFRAKVSQDGKYGRNRTFKIKSQQGPSRNQRKEFQIELLSKTLPTIKTVEWCWNIVDGYVLFYSTSNSVNDSFLVYFYETFGIALQPSNPLFLLEDEDDKKNFKM